MTLQTSRNVRVAYKQEVTLNTPPGASGATQFRANAGSGLSLSRQTINAGEIRSDLKVTMGRLGSKEVKGSYAGDLSVGTFDPLLAAIMRNTWSAVINASQADFTSVTQTANSIVGASGSFLAKGFTVGDVVQLNATGGPAANNNRNLRVTSVSATTLGIAETLTVDAVARTTFTLVRDKKLVQPATPIRSSFTFEETNQDILTSEQFTGCRVSSMKLTGKPNGMVDVEFGIVGTDVNVLTGGASPYYTTPTLTSVIGLVMSDATLRVGGADVVNLTTFDLMVDLKAKTEPVVGSMISPDIFDNASDVTGTLSAIRKDMAYLTNFTAETEIQFQALLVDTASEPKNYISIFIPRVKLTGSTKAFGQDGPMISTHPFIVGAQDGSVAGLDNSMLTIVTSAP